MRVFFDEGHAICRAPFNLHQRYKITLITLFVLLKFSWVHANPDRPTTIKASTQPRLSIIIDDLGYRLESGKQAIQLPGSVTVAIIPFTPYGKRLAELAKQGNKEVMLHAPMETLRARKWEKGLNLEMSKRELIASFQAMLADIPYVQGVNNHGGSLLTQSITRMDWLMSELRKQNLYFVDSKTTSSSVAENIANEAQLNSRRRDIFLDNKRELNAIQEQFEKAVRIALKHGSAIAIGHPHRETITVLKKNLPRLENQGIALVPISKLFHNQENTIPHLVSEKAPSTKISTKEI